MISKPCIAYFKSEMEPYFDWELNQLVWASPCSLKYFNAICDLEPPEENIQVWLIENRNLPANHNDFVGHICWVDAELFDDRWTFAGMDVSEAMDALQDQHFVRRVDWDQGEALSIEHDWTSDRLPWIVHHSKRGSQPWSPTQSDLLNKDWTLVK